MNRARVTAVIRHLERLGQATKRRAIPRAQHPEHIAAAYGEMLDRLVVRPILAAAATARSVALYRLAVRPVAAAAATMQALDARGDAGMPPSPLPPEVQRALDSAGERMADAWEPRDLHAAAARFGRQADAFQREQLDRQVRAAIGVPLDAIERPIRDMIPSFTSANAELVRTVPDRYLERLRADVTEAFEKGMTADALAKRFEELDGMTSGDAERIARDQIGKLSAQVNRERQEALGVERFTWRTLNDNRVCDECDQYDGVAFDWSDPPCGEGPGHCHPMDRCFAEPILGDLTGEESGEESEENGGEAPLEEEVGVPDLEAEVAEVESEATVEPPTETSTVVVPVETPPMPTLEELVAKLQSEAGMIQTPPASTPTAPPPPSPSPSIEELHVALLEQHPHPLSVAAQVEAGAKPAPPRAVDIHNYDVMLRRHGGDPAVAERVSNAWTTSALAPEAQTLRGAVAHMLGGHELAERDKSMVAIAHGAVSHENYADGKLHVTTARAMATAAQSNFPDGVVLSRGLRGDQAAAISAALARGEKEVRVAVGVLSSWTEKPAIAESFSGSAGVMLQRHFPRDSIFTSHRENVALHGFGEHEVVVMNDACEIMIKASEVVMLNEKRK